MSVARKDREEFRRRTERKCQFHPAEDARNFGPAVTARRGTR